MNHPRIRQKVISNDLASRPSQTLSRIREPEGHEVATDAQSEDIPRGWFIAELLQGQSFETVGVKLFEDGGRDLDGDYDAIVLAVFDAPTESMYGLYGSSIRRVSVRGVGPHRLVGLFSQRTTWVFSGHFGCNVSKFKRKRTIPEKMQMTVEMLSPSQLETMKPMPLSFSDTYILGSHRVSPIESCRLLFLTHSKRSDLCCTERGELYFSQA